jgi:hypothetical protein
MRQFRPDPYPNPINVDRHPNLAPLDTVLRREALGLPVKHSAEDKQFLGKMDAWLQSEAERKESDRILAETEHKRQKQAARQRKRVFGKERPKSFNEYLAALRSERKQRQYDDYEDEDYEYEAEQRRNEQKWLQHRNMQYKSGARFSQDTTSVLDAHVSGLHGVASDLHRKANGLQQLWRSEGQGSAYGD